MGANIQQVELFLPFHQIDGGILVPVAFQHHSIGIDRARVGQVKLRRGKRLQVEGSLRCGNGVEQEGVPQENQNQSQYEYDDQVPENAGLVIPLPPGSGGLLRHKDPSFGAQSISDCTFRSD